MVGKVWTGFDDEFRRKTLASALDAHGEDTRRHYVSLAAKALRMRPASMLLMSSARIAERFARGFSQLSERDQVGWLGSRYAGALATDFNACIGLETEAPAPPDAPPRVFTEACLASFAERHGENELTLALAWTASGGRADCRLSARRILETRAERSRSNAALRGSTMQESERIEPGASTEPPKDLAVEVVNPRVDDVAPTAAAVVLDAADTAQESAVLPEAEKEPQQSSDSVEIAAPADAGARPWSHPEGALSGLDRLTIQAIVTTLLGQTAAAISRKALAGLVREVVELNVQRVKSYYLLGFLHGIRKEQQVDLGLAANRARRGWYLSGHLHGTARIGGPAALLEALGSLSDPEVAALTDPTAHGALHRLLPTIVDAAIEEDEPAVIARWMPLAGPSDELSARRALHWALRLPRLDDPMLSGLLAVTTSNLMECLTAANAPSPNSDADLVQGLLALIGISRENGASDSAADQLNLPSRLARRVKQAPEQAELPADGMLRAEVGAAVVLARLGFDSPVQFIPTNTKDAGRTLTRLRGMLESENIEESHVFWTIERLLKAIRRCASEAVPTGSMDQLVDEAAEFSFSLRRLAVPRWGSMRCDELTQTLEVLGALVALLAAIEDKMDPSLERVVGWLDERGTIDPELCKRVVEHAAVFGCANLASLLRVIVDKHGPNAVKMSDIQQFAHDKDSRQGLLVLLTSAEAPIAIDERWDALAALAQAAANSHDRVLADACLDDLRARAAGNTRRLAPRMLELLQSPVWLRIYDESEINEIVIDLAARSGNYDEVGVRIAAEMQSALSGKSFALAEDYLEMLDQRGLGRFAGPEQREWLRRELESEASARSAALKTGFPVRIYFIGGNEIQRQWDESIQRRLQQETPGISVDFLHTGWDSNWGVHLEEITRRIDHYSAVVLMKFVRTNLGQHVRRLASEHRKPWIPCTGHGAASVFRSIVHAAAVARMRRL